LQKKKVWWGMGHGVTDHKRKVKRLHRSFFFIGSKKEYGEIKEKKNKSTEKKGMIFLKMNFQR